METHLKSPNKFSNEEKKSPDVGSFVLPLQEKGGIFSFILKQKKFYANLHFLQSAPEQRF